MSYLTVFGTIEFGKSQIGDATSPMYIGGNAIAASLAAAKVVQVYLMGVVGTDMDLHLLEKALGEKISIKNVEQYTGKTFQYTAVYNKKSFDIKDHIIDFGVYGAYVPLVKVNATKNTRNILFSGSNPKHSLKVLKQLKSPKVIGVATMLYHLQHNYEYAITLIKEATYFFTNKKEYNFLQNKIPNIFNFSKNLQYIFITDGKNGVTVVSKKGKQHFSFNKVISPTDPTNAGDVFAGTIMGLLVKGNSLKKDLKEIIATAHKESTKVIMNDPYYRKVYKKPNTILDQILENKADEIIKAKTKVSLQNLKRNLSKRKTEVRSFAQALKKENQISLIAEIKKASPSKGLIKSKFNHKAIAKIYQKSGLVDAISVLTDEKFFQGKLSFIKDIKELTTIPILRKDFIIDEYQIYESYLAEADAILLIVAALNKAQLTRLIKTAEKLGLACLVEVHTVEELKVALQAKAKIIGINARDLKSFTIDKKLFGELLSDIPESVVKVAESGIENYDDVKKMYKSGANAVLVGSSIMETNNMQEKLQELKGIV